MSTFPDDGPNKGPTAIIVCAVFQCLATTFAAARVFCRVRLLDRLYPDDWIIMLALVCGWVAFALTVVGVHYGDGRHMDTLTTNEQSQVLLWTISGFFPGILSISLPKLAVVSLLCRMLRPSKRNRRFMYCMCVVLVVNAFVCFGMLFGRCRPFRAVWDISFPANEKECFSVWHVVGIATFTGAFALAADLYLAIYPSLVLRRLKMNRRKKVALSCALGVGSISVVVAAYKCTRLSSMASADFSYDTADLTIWTIVEGAVVNIAASIPLLKPLVDMLLGKSYMGDTSYPRPSNAGVPLTSDVNLGSRSTKKKRALSASKMLESILDDANGSQDSIVTKKKALGDDQEGCVAKSSGKPTSTTTATAIGHNGGGILLTHNVEITFSSADSSASVVDAEQRKREWSGV